MLLGVTGGIASYKSPYLARLLTQAGADVDVILTRSAREFVGAVTFEALTGRPVYSELVAAGHALDHIKLARAADAMVIAPATADFLARAAHGQADDLLAACLLATRAAVLLVPAMNDGMWSHSQTQANVTHLRSLGYSVLEPDTGELAVGEGSGPGRMPEPQAIFAHLGRRLEPAGLLTGRNVLVTAGPTRESIDPVRFISNRSSGRMGVAIAAAAWRRGAEVTLVAGPLGGGVEAPVGVKLVPVLTAQEMLDAVSTIMRAADLLVMAAAPADFRPESVGARKIRKESRPAAIELVDTPDILRASVAVRREGSVAVGFALETHDVIASGRRKLAAKDLDLIVVNDATEAGAGFEVETNRVALIGRDGAVDELPLMSKAEVADAILDRAGGLLRGP
ncbi:MAG: bifunctional phosphopantothenoylcysteine decarboxylase/phosphopantothenate--cysteine ligase CoaBC [Gemmatimonadota bacterium]